MCLLGHNAERPRPPVVKPPLYGTRRFISALTSTCPYPEPDQSSPHHPIPPL
jgi:hypothetical protein